MISRSSKILADENIQGEVVEYLRNQSICQHFKPCFMEDVFVNYL
jgi:hypothetical protein